MKVKRSIIVWFCWVVAVMFFASATYLAPGIAGDGRLTALEFFLFDLGLIHMVAGVGLLAHTFEQENSD